MSQTPSWVIGRKGRWALILPGLAFVAWVMDLSAWWTGASAEVAIEEVKIQSIASWATSLGLPADVVLVALMTVVTGYVLLLSWAQCSEGVWLLLRRWRAR